ncbi:ABC transporter ATP-binding protein [Aquihabitans sp. G128]|uniref:ABC transporter ATP-binding protein n=1 Tax=Aquihabitans sp. G128 TaxID=2849779 RepID=UPI0020B342BF|nr:ABC transporter ATP-binding protein [Aquihabitans sp. G128]
MDAQIYRMMSTGASAAKSATLTPGLVRRVWSFAHAYRARTFGFLAIVVVESFLGLAPPLVIKAIIDDAVPKDDRRLVTVLAGIMIVVAFLNASLSMVERWLSSTIGEGLIYDLRSALFDHVQRQPIAFFTRTQTGALVSRMNNDVIGAQRAVTGTLGTVVSNVVTLATTLVAMAVLEWRLTGLSLLLLPVFLLPAKRVGRRLAGITREGFDLNASMNTTMTERFGVSGALLVKLFGQHDRERDGFADRAARVRDIGVRSAMYSRTFVVALTMVGAVGTAVIYLIGGRLVISGSITTGTLVALGVFVAQIYSPLTSLTNARVDLMTAFVSFDRVFEVLDAPNPITDHPDAVELVAPTGRIDFDAVTFAYPSGAESSVTSLESAAQLAAPDLGSGPVLHDLSASILPGELVAIVGPSGAGKTTLTQLVPRLYDTTAGAVRVDGHDVRDLTQASLRAAIGVVSQDPHLFHETVAENLRYAKPGATLAEMEAAARAARIHEVIAAMPDGYDTVVGERGHRLSGGEQQRLAIARMLLKDPAIVILDEATSNLDSENEAAVQEALARALEGRTSLVIAHRLSTITDADRILVLDHGRLVEQGRHADLLAAGGLYADLYRTLVRADRTAP